MGCDTLVPPKNSGGLRCPRHAISEAPRTTYITFAAAALALPLGSRRWLNRRHKSHTSRPLIALYRSNKILPDHRKWPAQANTSMLSEDHDFSAN